MPAMKVLLVSHLYPNPAEPLNGIFVAEYAKALSSIADVEVLAPVSEFPLLRKSRGIPAQEDFGRFQVFHPTYLALPRRLFNQRWRPYLWATRNYLRGAAQQPDIIHCHWLYPDALAVTHWRKSKRQKVVATIHGHAAVGVGIGAVDSPIHKTTLDRVDHLIAVSSELRQLLIDEFAVPADKISVQLNGIDTQQFKPAAQAEARQSLSLPQDKKIILAVARLSPEKQLDLLLEAISKCQDRDFLLYLAGDGPLRAALEQQSRQLGLSSRVIFLGGMPHDSLPTWYQAADAFVLSSAHEGCPVVIHEAMACGIPVVSTRVGTLPDLITSPALGLLSDPGDTTTLAHHLDLALQTKWDHSAIAREGARHTWNAVAANTCENIYQRLISPS